MAEIIFGQMVTDRRPKTRVSGTTLILVNNGSVSGTTVTLTGTVSGTTLTV